MKSIFALLFLAVAALAANPYLDLKDDQPVATTYAGKEWGDEIASPTEDGVDFTAKVTMQRLAAMPWGQVVKVSFAPKSNRVIAPLYLIVTDGQILLLPGGNTEQEVKAISEMKRQPRYERSDIRALAGGSLNFQAGPWTTKLTSRGGTCTYLTSHNSGHFTKFVWAKGAGLVEFSEGQGAMQDGFRLKKK